MRADIHDLRYAFSRFTSAPPGGKILAGSSKNIFTLCRCGAICSRPASFRFATPFLRQMTTQCGQADGGGTDYDSEPVDDFRDTKDQQADKQLSGERLRTTPGTQSGKKIDGGTNINASVWRRNKQLEHERVGCANLLSLGLCVAESCVQCFCAWDRHTQRRVGVPLCLELLIEGNCTLKGCTDLHPKK